MSNITVNLDATAAVIAAAELRDRERWYAGRAALLAILRGDEPASDGEVIDRLMARQCAIVAEALEAELYRPAPVDEYAGDHHVYPAGVGH